MELMSGLLRSRGREGEREKKGGREGGREGEGTHLVVSLL